MNKNCCLLSALSLAFSLTSANPLLAQEKRIYINADQNTLLRSFVDIADGKRVTHAISVGTPQQVHYTYDADNGKLILLWRGDFLDATPMWHDRGDGSSRSRGKTIQLGKAIPEIQRLDSRQAELKGDTAGSGYKPKGYNLDKNGLPTFKYQTYGTSVKDMTRVIEGGKGLRREIKLEGGTADLYICVAQVDEIKEGKKGVFLPQGQPYSIAFDKSNTSKPFLRTIGGKKELLIPAKSTIRYSILFND